MKRSEMLLNISKVLLENMEFTNKGIISIEFNNLNKLANILLDDLEKQGMLPPYTKLEPYDELINGWDEE